MKIRKFLAFWLLIICCSGAFAQPRNFRHYRTEDGLQSNTILSCMQDSNGFIWIGTKDGLSIFDGSEFRNFEAAGHKSCMNGRIQSIVEAPDGKIWIDSSNGIGFYDPLTDVVTVVDEKMVQNQNYINIDKEGDVWVSSRKRIMRYISSAGHWETYSCNLAPSTQPGAVSDDGRIWFGEMGGSLRYFDRSTGIFRFLDVLPEEDIEKGVVFSNIAASENNTLLLSTSDNRIFRLDVTSGKAVCINQLQDWIKVNCILSEDEGRYLVGCLQGVLVCSDSLGTENFITDNDPHSLSNTNVTCMTKDSDGNIWLGTYHGGVNLYHNPQHRIIQHYKNTSGTSITGKIVRAICSDNNGDIWVGTEDGGLCRFIVKERRIEDLAALNSFGVNNYHSIIRNGDEMWVATFGRGIFILDAASGEFKDHLDIGDNQIINIMRASNGYVYIGTATGLYLYREGRETMKIPELQNAMVHYCFQDSRGNVWIGTYGRGLWKKKATENLFKYVESPDYITYLYEDPLANLWIATEGEGACYRNIDSDDEFTYITKEDGLPSNITCAITCGILGNIWISTIKGLVMYNPYNKIVEKVYQDDNGTVGDSYCYGACYQSPNGNLHFGTYNGLIVFSPENLGNPIDDATLFITDIHTGAGKTFKALKEKGKSTIYSEEISFKKKDGTPLTIGFSAICYSNMGTIRYRYSLMKRGKGETVTTTENKAVYTDLAPGTYVFDVSIEGNNTPQGHRTLKIKVVPPLYLSMMAQICYIAIALLIGLSLLMHYIRRKRFEEEQKMVQMEALKQKEIYDAKINFFTNITHEIRTPLSLIKMPVEKIIEEKAYPEKSKEDIMTIKANTERLLNLTNQLLDIKKMEKGEITINCSDFDICQFSRKISDYFRTAIHDRHLQFSLDIPDGKINVNTDSDKVEKIICNLMSNAVKYSQSKIAFTLTRLDNGKIRIRVDSDGYHLTEDEREKIFMPFYQVRTVTSQLIGSNGTGLGLPYSRHLAAALGGDLYVDSSDNENNSFVFEFPVKSKIVAETKEKPEKDEYIDEGAESGRHCLLVVEDSEEMKSYLCKELGKDYKVLSAANGEDAIVVLQNHKVDMVISDIMMPVMDGYQLCNRIKNDIEFSHIPVILMTAAVGVKTHIETLDVGAEGYIEKPFSIDLLKAQINNLFMNREITYNQFATSPLTHFNSVVMNNIDKDFMDRLLEVISDRISEQELNIDTLTEALHTSKSTLFRKVKANIGVSVNEYIRICRLKKAAELLSTNKYKINEVAYLTGFSSPSYFATCFQKQFNISPSNFIKNLTTTR